MQTGYALLFFLVTTFSEECCVGNQSENKTGPRHTLHFRVVKGESFLKPCNTSTDEMCFLIEEDGQLTSVNCGTLSTQTEPGSYTCSLNDRRVHLQVVEKTSLQCSEPETKNITLVVAKGGEILCPGHSCYSTDILWYKGYKKVCQHRCCKKENSTLKLCQVQRIDRGLYFCDRQITEEGVMWTFRRAVHVETIQRPTEEKPSIVHPTDSNIEMVELGQKHTLICEATFRFQEMFSGNVKWYRNYNGNMKNMTELPMESPEQKTPKYGWVQVTRKAIIKEVDQQHLRHTYTCIARNTFGSVNATVKLKLEVKWSSLVCFPVVSFLLVAVLGIVFHVKWLEVQLIYRTHFQHGLNGDEKEFDVLLSYVWSPPSAEVEGGLNFDLSTPSRPDSAYFSSLGTLNREEGKSPRAPEMLLRQLLEDQWRYRLCLLERDVVPGEAYTNDVVRAIQRSKMLICLLSDDYLSNNDAVFVLESGVQALLQHSAPKLLLIWTRRTSTSLIQADPPLPPVVQRALKVLPSLKWTSDKPAGATSNFLRSLQKALPKH